MVRVLVAGLSVLLALRIDVSGDQVRHADQRRLEEARAEQLTVTKNILLGASNQPRPAFSRDGTLLAFVNYSSQNDPSRVTIFSLVTETATRTIQFARAIEGIAISPDNSQLIAIDRQDNATVANLKTGILIELGKIPTIRTASQDEIIWAEANHVHFIAQDYPTVSESLDLQTLTGTRISNDQGIVARRAAELRRTPVDHAAVYLARSSAPCTNCSFSYGISAFNRDGSYENVIFSGNWTSAHFARTAAHVVIENRERQLRLLKIGIRPKVPSSISASLIELPDVTADSKHVDDLKRALAQGYAVYADVFSPRRNPLNLRVVGTEGTTRGRLQVGSFGEDGSISGQLVRESQGHPNVGDLVRNFRVLGLTEESLSSITAEIKGVRDGTIVPIHTGPAAQFVLQEPEQIVLSFLDAYFRADLATVNLLLSPLGLSNARSFCSGNAANCLRENYSKFGAPHSREAFSYSFNKVMLQTAWGSEKQRQCQEFELAHTPAGWRISSWERPSRCR